MSPIYRVLLEWEPDTNLYYLNGSIHDEESLTHAGVFEGIRRLFEQRASLMRNPSEEYPLAHCQRCGGLCHPSNTAAMGWYCGRCVGEDK